MRLLRLPDQEIKTFVRLLESIFFLCMFEHPFCCTAGFYNPNMQEPLTLPHFFTLVWLTLSHTAAVYAAISQAFLQISATDVLVSTYSFLASLIFSGESAFGRPPRFPLVLAASNPALVRSLMMSRSNSASAPKCERSIFRRTLSYQCSP